MIPARFLWSLLILLPVVYSYLVYPLLLELWYRFRKPLIPNPAFPADWPQVFVLMAAHNEESVIDQKIRSVLNSNYPPEKISFFIGSDCSTDQTNAILQSFAEKYPGRIYPHFHTIRQGKPGIINQLFSIASPPPGSVLILTDANVIFTPENIRHLVLALQDSSVGVVSSWITNPENLQSGIAPQEKFYVNWENNLKYKEGLLFQSMVGPAGGCFAMRPDLFKPVPEGFIADDFYWGMSVMESGFGSVMEKKAVCIEDVPARLSDEFKRKSRIAQGNFQNLQRFSRLIFAGKGIGFCFFSHKVLRWCSPFLMLLFALVTGGCLVYNRMFPEALVWFSFPFISAAAAGLLNLLDINPFLLRAFNYFVAMNVAILYGFTKYLKGRSESVWEPTRRNS